MKRGRKFSEAEKEHFLEGISGQCTSEDTPVSEVIAVHYGGNADAYIEAMLRFDPHTAEYLRIVSYRPAKSPAAPRAPQKAGE